MNLIEQTKRMKALLQVKHYNSDLSKLDPIYCDDEEIVMESVSKYGWNLEYASENLKDKESIVLAALEQTNGAAMQHASERLKYDEDFANLIMEKGYTGAYPDFSEEIQTKIAQKLLKGSIENLKNIDYHFIESPMVIKEIVNCEDFNFITDYNKLYDLGRVTDKRFLELTYLEVLNQDPNNFYNFPPEMKANNTIAITAIVNGVPLEDVISAQREAVCSYEFMKNFKTERDFDNYFYYNITENGKFTDVLIVHINENLRVLNNLIEIANNEEISNNQKRYSYERITPNEARIEYYLKEPDAFEITLRKNYNTIFNNENLRETAINSFENIAETQPEKLLHFVNTFNVNELLNALNPQENNIDYQAMVTDNINKNNEKTEEIKNDNGMEI